MSTGGGFMDGTITFVDGFVLPGLGGSVAFGASDISGIVFNHVESAFTGGGGILPVFSYTASAANITSASGTVFNIGGTISLVSPFIQTDVAGSLFRNPGGVVSGDYFIDGITTGILADTIGGISQPPNTKVAFGTNSEFPGVWRKTGDTTPPRAPEPASLALLGAGAALVAWRRRRSAG